MPFICHATEGNFMLWLLTSQVNMIVLSHRFSLSAEALFLRTNFNQIFFPLPFIFLYDRSNLDEKKQQFVVSYVDLLLPFLLASRLNHEHHSRAKGRLVQPPILRKCKVFHLERVRYVSCADYSFGAFSRIRKHVQGHYGKDP